MRIDDNVLRHLVVRLESGDGDIDVEARKADLAKQEREARERDLEQKRRKE